MCKNRIKLPLQKFKKITHREISWSRGQSVHVQGTNGPRLIALRLNTFKCANCICMNLYVESGESHCAEFVLDDADLMQKAYTCSEVRILTDTCQILRFFSDFVVHLYICCIQLNYFAINGGDYILFPQ